MTLYHVHYVRTDGTKGSIALDADSQALARLGAANQLADNDGYDNTPADWQITAVVDPATPRPLWVIARDIRAHWPKVYFGAVPYLQAMHSLESIADHYGEDSAKSVVLYFLSNASTWRGTDARRIKAELKAMVK